MVSSTPVVSSPARRRRRSADATSSAVSTSTPEWLSVPPSRPRREPASDESRHRVPRRTTAWSDAPPGAKHSASGRAALTSQSARRVASGNGTACVGCTFQSSPTTAPVPALTRADRRALAAGFGPSTGRMRSHGLLSARSSIATAHSSTEQMRWRTARAVPATPRSASPTAGGSGAPSPSTTPSRVEPDRDATCRVRYRDSSC